MPIWHNVCSEVSVANRLGILDLNVAKRSFSWIGSTTLTQELLFKALKSEPTAEGRQRLVDRSLQSGLDLNSVSEMLDYIDWCASMQAKPDKTLPSWRSRMKSLFF